MKVMYIGNSYTFCNNLPMLVDEFFKASGVTDSGYGRYLRGGASFQTHWLDNFGKDREPQEPRLQPLDKERIGGIDELLGMYKWDVVVMQSHSQDTFIAEKEFFEFGHKIAERVRAAGHKRIVMYETWARQATPEMQDTITEKYCQLANEIDAEVAPVGRSWREAFKRIDDLVLHVEDGSHPNAIGSYLAGCAFYNIFSGKTPVGLPASIEKILNAEGKKVYDFTDEQAATYQQIVADIVAESLK